MKLRRFHRHHLNIETWLYRWGSEKRRAEAQKSKQRGYALDNEEAEQGVGCIGVAGLSISAPRERRQDAWVPLLKKAGEQLSARLGFRPASVW